MTSHRPGRSSSQICGETPTVPMGAREERVRETGNDVREGETASATQSNGWREREMEGGRKKGRGRKRKRWSGIT